MPIYLSWHTWVYLSRHWADFEMDSCVLPQSHILSAEDRQFFTLRIFSTWIQHTVEHAQPHFGSCCRAKQYSEYRRWICTVTLKELLGLVNNSISKWCQHEDLSFGRFEVHFRTKFLVGRYWRHSLKQHRIILPTHVSAQDTSVTRSHGSHHNTCWSWKLPKW